MKYTKIFNNHTEYETYMNNSVYYPNISYCQSEDDLHFNGYLQFDDLDVWTICCTNWGDYIETVIVDNTDNTVNITKTFKSMLNNIVKINELISVETNIDNNENTYEAGTTKEPVGITIKQCEAVTQSSLINKFDSINSTSHKFEEFQYFKSVTSLKQYNNFVKCEGTLIFPPNFVSWQDAQAYTQSVTTFIFPSTLTNFNLHRGGISRTTAIFVFKGSTPPTIDFSYFNPIASGNTCKIYVPDDAIDTYKQATTFSNYSQIIYPLSEYKRTK